MEQKPIKRNPNILFLSKDHHFTLLFCWKIREGLKKGIDTERIKSYIRHFLDNNMRSHFREEEEILFAAARDEQVQRARKDHREIEDQVNAVLQSSGDGQAAAISKLSDMVDQHVRYEERELFPSLERSLSPAQLDSIGERLKGEPLLMDDFKDEFWLG